MSLSPDRIHALCDAMGEGTLDAAGADELERLVVADAEARRTYIRRTHLHTALHRAVDPASAAVPNLNDAEAPTPLRSGREWAFVFVAAMAAALLIASTWVATVFITAEPAPAPPPATIGVIVDAVGTTTGIDGLVDPGMPLLASGYEVADGMIEAQLHSGVTVRVIGPAVVRFDHARIGLHSGKLWVDTGQSGGAVLVRTPSATIRNIGTVFGVAATRTTTDVHVYEGRVELKPGGRGAASIIDAGQARRASDGEVVAIDMQSDAFGSHSPLTLAPRRPMRNLGFEAYPPDQPRRIADWVAFGIADPEHPNVLRDGEPIVAPHRGAAVAKVFGRFDPEHRYSGLYQAAYIAPGELCAASVVAAHKSGDALAGSNAAWCKLEFLNEDGEVVASTPSASRLTSDAPADVYHRLRVEAVAPPDASVVRLVLVFEQDLQRSPGAALFDEAAFVINPPTGDEPDPTPFQENAR